MEIDDEKKGDKQSGLRLGSGSHGKNNRWSVAMVVPNFTEVT